ncbi:carbonic anhydrase family protein [Myxococcus sp. SDU36]|uniref:carbonic anhydrase family protein n=1 Tax=Myxococcus sp. SDU36 TaxID=2831967 RepID=UPI002543731D|nr:carbonic anhydrase family protein [Myxococcus sp. SDU36]
MCAAGLDPRNLPKHAGEHSQPLGARINASSLLPFNKAFSTYAGSLTTPPCTEGLQWYVMKNPIEMSDSQIAAFQRLPYVNPNNRPLQPLNGRTVSTQRGHCGLGGHVPGRHVPDWAVSRAAMRNHGS